MLKHLFAASVFGVTVSTVALAGGPLDNALELMRKGQFVEAAKALESVAKAGDPTAQYQLGLLYYNGKGVPEDEKKAVQLLTSSAEKGNVDAMYQLGNAYTFGSETPRLVADADIEAANWYFKAAKAGNADAQYSLGLLFMAGKGLVKNEKEASYWMQQAARNGHKDAKNYVGSAK